MYVFGGGGVAKVPLDLYDHPSAVDLHIHLPLAAVLLCLPEASAAHRLLAAARHPARQRKSSVTESKQPSPEDNSHGGGGVEE